MDLFPSFIPYVYLLWLASVAVPCPAHATDREAAELSLQALEKAKQGGTRDYEDAFSMLYEAWELADTEECRNIINEHLKETETALNENVRQHRPAFLDEPDDARGDVYKRLADYGNARGQRLYAELGATGQDMAVQYLFKAARGGDGRACHIAAYVCMYGGLPGVTRNQENARQWLFAAARAGYAPAKEKLAAIYWEGDPNWGVKWDQALAQQYLREAIGLYRNWTLSNISQQEKFVSFCEQLEHVDKLMTAFRNRASGSIIKGFYPSFLAMRLSFYSESDGGLRARMTYINEFMQRYPISYHIDALPQLDLAYVPINMAKLGENHLGMQYSKWPEKGKVDLRIQIDSEAMPALENTTGAERETAYWRREMALNSTIAHELAHAYLDTLYSYNNSDTRCGKPLVEGHAESAEFAFLSNAYYAGQLSVDDYAAMQSNAYAGYFRWYRKNCLNDNDCTDWEAVDRWAKESGGSGKCSRTPIPSRYGLQYVPEHLNLFFQGYL